MVSSASVLDLGSETEERAIFAPVTELSVCLIFLDDVPVGEGAGTTRAGGFKGSELELAEASSAFRGSGIAAAGSAGKSETLVAPAPSQFRVI